MESRRLIEDNLRQFLVKHAAASFREWLRDFHGEYDDKWFEANYQRLELAFKPIWDDRLKSKSVNKSVDLLEDFFAPEKKKEDLLFF
jgi:hypothetical protein